VQREQHDRPGKQLAHPGADAVDEEKCLLHKKEPSGVRRMAAFFCYTVITPLPLPAAGLPK
jgi:hypothetical protein